MMNLAVRLCDDAEPSEILVSERVFSEIEHIASSEPAGELDLKGFLKPVTAFRVIDAELCDERVSASSERN